ncbi:hypothetical protein ACLOJK_036895 [Asimina triloba]
MRSLKMRFNKFIILNSNVHEALSKTKQAVSLQEYLQEFERSLDQAQNWTKEALKGSFIGGLKENLQAQNACAET